jgi:hypothetical protein
MVTAVFIAKEQQQQQQPIPQQPDESNSSSSSSSSTSSSSSSSSTAAIPNIRYLLPAGYVLACPEHGRPFPPSWILARNATVTHIVSPQGKVYTTLMRAWASEKGLAALAALEEKYDRNPVLPKGYSLKIPMASTPLPPPWIMAKSATTRNMRIVSSAGKVYKNFKKAWASEEGLAAAAATGKDGLIDKHDDQEEIEADQVGNWDDEAVVGNEQEGEKQVKQVFPRDKRKNDDDGDDEDKQEEVVRKQTPPPPPRQKAKKNDKPAPQSSVSVKDWIASLDSELNRFADAFEFTDWPALFNYKPNKLYIMGIPEDTVLPMMSLIEQEREGVEGGR